MKIRVSLTMVLIAVGCMAQTACFAPTDEPESEEVDTSEEALAMGRANTTGWKAIPSMTDAQRDAIIDKYASVPHAGVRTDLFETAILYYDTNYARIPKKDSLVLIDFAKHSKNKRFFILDMKNRGPMKSYVTSHGENSDPNNDGMATSFSNVNGSLQSSLGFYVTAETYISTKNGESLRLDGLSSTNSNVRQRAVVIHKAAYVEDGRSKQGMSQGCPALPVGDAFGVIARIKNGTLMYADN